MDINGNGPSRIQKKGVYAGEVVTVGDTCYEPAFTLQTPAGKNLLTYEFREVVNNG